MYWPKLWTLFVRRNLWVNKRGAMNTSLIWKNSRKKYCALFRFPQLLLMRAVFLQNTHCCKGTPKLLQLNSVAARDDGNISSFKRGVTLNIPPFLLILVAIIMHALHKGQVGKFNHWNTKNNLKSSVAFSRVRWGIKVCDLALKLSRTKKNYLTVFDLVEFMGYAAITTIVLHRFMCDVTHKNVSALNLSRNFKLQRKYLICNNLFYAFCTWNNDANKTFSVPLEQDRRHETLSKK